MKTGQETAKGTAARATILLVSQCEQTYTQRRVFE